MNNAWNYVFNDRDGEKETIVPMPTPLNVALEEICKVVSLEVGKSHKNIIRISDDRFFVSTNDVAFQFGKEQLQDSLYGLCKEIKRKRARDRYDK